MIAFPDISPEIFVINLFGLELALRWYAVSYIVGFIIALRVIKFYIGRESFWQTIGAPMNRDHADSLITYLILGVLIGGRLGYVIFYNFSYYITEPLEVLKVWDGGMSFHGGFVGVIISYVLFVRKNNLRFWSGADLIALASPPGIFLGRMANFINNELWGKPTTQPWGVIFPGERAQDCPEFTGICARHPSQLYEAGLEGLLLFLILLFFANIGGLRRPGLITGIFFVGYSASRFFVEYYRVPDPQFFSPENPFGYAFVYGNSGMTMGQVLSLPMLFFGLALFLFATIKKR